MFLWSLYVDIKKGCDEITYANLSAYESVKQKKLTSGEADLMLKIDSLRKKNG